MKTVRQIQAEKIALNLIENVIEYGAQLENLYTLIESGERTAASEKREARAVVNQANIDIKRLWLLLYHFPVSDKIIQYQKRAYSDYIVFERLFFPLG